MLGEGALLPGGWDPSRDLLVVVGRGAEPLLEELAAQGQRRVLLYLPEEARARPPRPARIVHTPIALFDRVLALRRPLPTRVLVQRQPDPWVSDEIYAEVSRTVDESLRACRLQASRRDRLGPARLLQAAAALSEIAAHASVAALDGAFAKRACFLVSPGPSLEQNAAQLRAVRGRALVLASTRALAPLKAQGVVPDLVLAAAPHPGLLSHYEGIDLGAVEALLIGATADPRHWRTAARRHIAFGDGDRIDAWVFEPFGEDASLRTCGSVSCSALSLALRMACDPIVFVGQDLAFTEQRVYSPASLGGSARIRASEDGHSFVVDDPSASEQEELESGQLVKVAGYKGGLVLTSEIYRSYLIWFETVARSLEGRTLFINATEGGANIRGMQHRKLADVIADYVRGEVDVGDVLDRRIGSLHTGRRRNQAVEAVKRKLAGLSECLELAGRCRVLAGEARADAARVRALQEAESALVAALSAAPLLSLMAPDEILAAEERVQAARTREQSLSAAEMLFGVVERSGGALRAPLAAALAELAELE